MTCPRCGTSPVDVSAACPTCGRRPRGNRSVRRAASVGVPVPWPLVTRVTVWALSVVLVVLSVRAVVAVLNQRVGI